MRRLTAAISRTNCTCIFTNQIREKIGVMFGSPETQPGGRALKFFASIRGVDIRRIGQIKDPSGKVIGNRTRMKVVKKQGRPPFHRVRIRHHVQRGNFPHGFRPRPRDRAQDPGKKGSWISYDGNLIGQGREAAKQYLADNPDVMAKVINQIYEQVKVTGGVSLAVGAGDATLTAEDN